MALAMSIDDNKAIGNIYGEGCKYHCVSALVFLYGGDYHGSQLCRC